MYLLKTEQIQMMIPWNIRLNHTKAANIMKAGDTCYIREGTYREMEKPSNLGMADAPITFMPYNDKKVVVSGVDLLEGT